eukprot:PRCOL_00001093-RA
MAGGWSWPCTLVFFPRDERPRLKCRGAPFHSGAARRSREAARPLQEGVGSAPACLFHTFDLSSGEITR